MISRIISKIFHKKNIKKTSTFFLITILIITVITSYQMYFEDKFYPTIFIGNSNVSAMTKTQARKVMEEQFDRRRIDELEYAYNNQRYIINLSQALPQINNDGYLDEAFDIGHQGSLAKRLDDQLKTALKPRVVSPLVNYDINSQSLQIAKKIYKPAIKASITLNEEAVVTTESEPGLDLDLERLKKTINEYLIFGNKPSFLPVKVVNPSASTYKAQRAKDLLASLSDSPLELKFNESIWKIEKEQLFEFINLDLEGDQFLDEEKIKEYVKNEVASKIDQPVIEALFKFDTGQKRVQAFKPAQQGQTLDLEKTSQLITLAVTGQRPKNITLPVDVIQPKSQTADVNNLGIKELIGKGISNFAGSIPNRIYNVNLTAQKIDGVLIPPGEVFSFNQTVGDISAATGFKQAYVIKEGRTVLDDGGGVCQVSTTLFRAALNAGLPVVKRTPHAYRVSYYEHGFPPGLDATVYYPSVDFQFKNDTGKHVLVQAYTDGLTLYVDFYGTSDGRVASLTKPTIAGQTPPPAEIRQDDPTLPKGVVKQVDWAAWGAKVSFSRTVTRGHETLIQENWISNYKAWQAVYLVGTQ